MPTNKPRTMITFNDEELFEQINTYRFENRFKSQNEALMDLINKGIEVLMGEAPKQEDEEQTPEEKRLLHAFRSADPIYKNVALEILEAHPAKKENRARPSAAM